VSLSAACYKWTVGAETFFEELKRYVRFGRDEEAALRRLGPHTRPYFQEIAEAFYERLAGHEAARRVFSGPEQIERLKGTMVVWLEGLVTGPWDEAYFQRRARIGRRHVEIELPQRYMFGAMDHIRIALSRIVNLAYRDDIGQRLQVMAALHKLLDMELAIMLESYREAFIEKVQYLERLEKANLERRLAVTSAQYDEVVEKGEALIATIDASGFILLFNAKCEAVTGLTREAASGLLWLELFAPPSEREAVAARHRDALAGIPCHPYEGAVQTPDGVGRRVRWHFKTLLGPEAPLLCAIGMDVTEEYDLAVRTRRAERLASLGTMAAGLAHEIRNPLNAAHLQLSVARRRLARSTGDSGAARAVELAGAEMARLAGLVEDFLQFARPQPLRLDRIDLRGLAHDTVALVAPEASELGAELEVVPGPPVLTELDHEKMKQVLLNLVRNAIEAAGSGGRVRIDVQATGDSAVLTVEDNGRGFPENTPIFEPFFTTKAGGTGLGLAIVHRIVVDHGGTVSAASRPGNTTIFSVVLPIGHTERDRGTVTA
jgi:PAS domain S-box-containing protein